MGFGVWQVPEDEVVAGCPHGPRRGVPALDTASAYGNERGVGQALAESGVARDEVFVTTKVWNDAHGRDATLRAFDASMERLGLDVLDLYLIHWPVPRQDRYVETWRGAARAPGRRDGCAPSVCATSTSSTSSAPSTRRRRVAEHQPDRAPPLPSAGTAAGLPRGARHRHRVVEPPGVGPEGARRPRRHAGRAQHDATPAQVVIAWHLALGLVVIPKSVTPSRIVENLAAVDLSLTARTSRSCRRWTEGSARGRTRTSSTRRDQDTHTAATRRGSDCTQGLPGGIRRTAFRLTWSGTRSRE